MGDAAVERLLAAAGCRTAEHVRTQWCGYDGVAYFSEGGVLYSIGTKGKTVPWSNPCVSGEVTCMWPSVGVAVSGGSVGDDSNVESFVSRPGVPGNEPKAAMH